MSLDREYGKIVFACDECDETLHTDEHDFDAARQALRDAGWRTEKNGDGSWGHYCCSMNVNKLGFRPLS